MNARCSLKVPEVPVPHMPLGPRLTATVQRWAKGEYSIMECFRWEVTDHVGGVIECGWTNLVEEAMQVSADALRRLR